MAKWGCHVVDSSHVPLFHFPSFSFLVIVLFFFSLLLPATRDECFCCGPATAH